MFLRWFRRWQNAFCDHGSRRLLVGSRAAGWHDVQNRGAAVWIFRTNGNVVFARNQREEAILPTVVRVNDLHDIQNGLAFAIHW